MHSDIQPVKRCVIEETLTESIASVTDYLAERTGLSKGRIKHALNCGALRVKKHKGGLQRVRRATAPIPSGSMISFHYDEALLAIKPQPSTLLDDAQQYSIWFKPPGILSQGTQWGDHCSLLRQVELHFQSKRQVYLVHRLDRDASGLMLVAHSGTMADKLSHMFASRVMKKQYSVRVQGLLQDETTVIDHPLDGKDAITRVHVLERDVTTTLLSVQIETGRKHQIRRHLSEVGHPVTGDTLYGERSERGLHLCAVRLAFQCPVRGRLVDVQVDEDEIRKYWR